MQGRCLCSAFCMWLRIHDGEHTAVELLCKNGFHFSPQKLVLACIVFVLLGLEQKHVK